MLDVNTITKIFNTGFIRQTPTATNTSQITWDSLGTSAIGQNDDKTITPSALHQEYVTVLENMFNSRAEYYQTIESISYSDKTLEIVDLLIDEILNAVNAQAPFTPAILESEPNAEKALRACKELNYKCDVYRYDRDMLKKLIIYGEYFLFTSTKPKHGITEINDLVEAKNILPLYKGYKVQEYLGFKKDFENKGQFSAFDGSSDKLRIDKNLLTHFAVSPNRYALNDKKESELIHKGLSTLVGVSVLYPTLSRLYRLQQLDAALDIQSLSQVARPQLIGVPISSNVKPTDYPEISRTYTNFLQPILGNNGSSQNINTILESLKTSGGFQVLPYPQGQGIPSSIQFNPTDLTGLNERLQNLSNSIDKALGVDNTDDQSRSQIYAMKSRLVKRLQDVLEARRLGWREIYLRHLFYSGIYVKEENFDVQMAALPDYDIFAEAEGLAHLIDSMKEVFMFANDVKSYGTMKSIDSQCLINMFDNYVGTRFPVLKGLFGNPVNTIDEYNEEQMGEDFSRESSMGSSFRDRDFELREIPEESEIEEHLEEPEIETAQASEETPSEE